MFNSRSHEFQTINFGEAKITEYGFNRFKSKFSGINLNTLSKEQQELFNELLFFHSKFSYRDSDIDETIFTDEDTYNKFYKAIHSLDGDNLEYSHLKIEFITKYDLDFVEKLFKDYSTDQEIDFSVKSFIHKSLNEKNTLNFLKLALQFNKTNDETLEDSPIPDEGLLTQILETKPDQMPFLIGLEEFLTALTKSPTVYKKVKSLTGEELRTVFKTFNKKIPTRVKDILEVIEFATNNSDIEEIEPPADNLIIQQELGGLRLINKAPDKTLAASLLMLLPNINVFENVKTNWETHWLPFIEEFNNLDTFYGLLDPDTLYRSTSYIFSFKKTIEEQIEIFRILATCNHSLTFTKIKEICDSDASTYHDMPASWILTMLDCEKKEFEDTLEHKLEFGDIVCASSDYGPNPEVISKGYNVKVGTYDLVQQGDFLIAKAIKNMTMTESVNQKFPSETLKIGKNSLFNNS